MKKAKSEETIDIPEVAEFIEAKEKLQRLKDAYEDVFEAFGELVEAYNTTLEAAEKAVRSKQVSCGPFDLYQWQTKYHPDKLYEEVGHETFLAVGGKVELIPTYSVDKTRLDAAIAADKLPQAVVDIVRVKSPRYKKPSKVNFG